MKEVLLEFPTLLALVDFTLAIDLTQCDIDRLHLTIACQLTDAQLELALNGFGASVITAS